MTARSLSAGSTLIAAIVLSGLVTATFGISPAQAITKSEVEEACTDSRGAYDAYQAARADFVEATEALDEANWALAEAEAKEQRIRGQYEANRNAQAELEPKAEAQAVDLYMQSVESGTAGLVALDKPGDALVALQFMSSSTKGRLQAINDLGALTAQLDRLGVDLESVGQNGPSCETTSRS